MDQHSYAEHPVIYRGEIIHEGEDCYLTWVMTLENKYRTLYGTPVLVG